MSTYYQWLRAGFLYYWRAHTRYDVHAPLAAAFAERVLEDRRNYYAFPVIEAVRQNWLQYNGTVHYATDPGAGSRAGQGATRTVNGLVRQSAVGPFFGQLLFRLALWRQPASVVEMGTSLGISTLYLRAALPRRPFITMEGNEEVAALADRSWRMAGLPPPEQYIGNFADQLPIALQTLGTLGLLFIDGDHREAATLNYFEQALPYLRSDSIVVIADIHWSPGMESAWAALRRRPEARLSIDLLHLGILFFDPAVREKQHYTLIPARYKPWRAGFFAPGVG